MTVGYTIDSYFRIIGVDDFNLSNFTIQIHQFRMSEAKMIGVTAGVWLGSCGLFYWCTNKAAQTGARFVGGVYLGPMMIVAATGALFGACVGAKSVTNDGPVTALAAGSALVPFVILVCASGP